MGLFDGHVRGNVLIVSFQKQINMQTVQDSATYFIHLFTTQKNFHFFKSTCTYHKLISVLQIRINSTQIHSVSYRTSSSCFHGKREQKCISNQINGSFFSVSGL